MRRVNSIGPPTRLSRKSSPPTPTYSRTGRKATFNELFSRFGTGGQLTPDGILAAAEAMNAKRDIWRQVNIILESGEAELLSQFVDVLYGRVTSAPPKAMPPITQK